MSNAFRGIVKKIIYQSPDKTFTVFDLQCDDGFSTIAVGNIPPIVEGEHVEIEGEWTKHRDYGMQIRVTSAKQLTPSTTGAIVVYLSSGLIRGVGESTARKLVEFFGDKTLEVIEKEPERLMDVPGIGRTRYRTIYQSYMQHISTRDIYMGLQGFGMTVLQASKAYKAYGANTLRLIKDNPYRLIDDIEGIGFKTADKIAEAAGYAPDSEFRLRAGVKYTLMCARQEGHTYLPIQELVDKACRVMDAEIAKVENMVALMIADAQVVCVNLGSIDAVFLPYLYVQESNCAKSIIALAGKRQAIAGFDVKTEIERLQKIFQIELADKQRDAVIEALTTGVMVITGGPGTGKTTILRFIKEILDMVGLEYELCAPTGRAAKRMSASTGCEARTIHRMLESNGNEFARNEENPVEADIVIVDEMSMVDISLMNALMKALTHKTRLILVGDADQLPPVGAGNVLKDIVTSDIVPVIRLNEIYRQSDRSMIITNAHEVNAGHSIELSMDDQEFMFESVPDANDVLNRLINMLTTGKGLLTRDTASDVQVLAPMKKGILGVNNINARLQAALNPPEPMKKERECGEVVFREGDKVMQVKNNYGLEWTITKGGITVTTGQGIYNGDLGTINHIDSLGQFIEVLFDDGKCTKYDFTIIDELTLAYCISIHKSQGSEFPIVILPLISGPRMLMTKNILYTAITRARNQVYILGSEDCVNNMIKNEFIMNRYSALGYFLSEAASYDIFAE